MNQVTLAWAAFKNMLRAAARDPVWALVTLALSPVRAGKYLLGVLILTFVVVFALVCGAELLSSALGLGVNSPIRIGLSLGAVLVTFIAVFRMLTNPMIQHFGNRPDATHGSARFATDAEAANLTQPGKGLLIGRDLKTGRLLRYAGPAHLLTIAPTRSGKGVGTLIPNLLTADRSVICIDPKGENARMAGSTRHRFWPVHVLDPFGVTGRPSAAFNLRLMVTQSLQDMARTQATPPAPVLYLLDEFAALGELAPIEWAMGLMASYGVQLWPIVQDVHQLRATYGQRAGTFLSKAGVLQVFGVNDHDSARLVSDLLGQKTVVFQTMSTCSNMSAAWM
ncbi:type IV secretory system conjugative DNA transfer family protein [Candidatus Burkholderia verschuerenii]|uniref:type IV secretory system conjugative DNA transfer family protein n=1 Tax=Candidatus Burkholderia verschuerenii TaxID=242163 RepID=UPI00067CA25D|nr:type IV secretory system conjugative DNA transfer family protein [Candidatus Burkholderia verschuerenii]